MKKTHAKSLVGPACFGQGDMFWAHEAAGIVRNASKLSQRRFLTGVPFVPNMTGHPHRSVSDVGFLREQGR